MRRGASAECACAGVAPRTSRPRAKRAHEGLVCPPKRRPSESFDPGLEHAHSGQAEHKAALPRRQGASGHRRRGMPLRLYRCRAGTSLCEQKLAESHTRSHHLAPVPGA